MSDLEFPNMRLEIVEAVRSLADPVFQRRVWVDGEPTGYEIEGLDQEITTLYDDTRAMDDPYGQIGITLRDEREAEAMQKLDRVLLPFYKSLPPHYDPATVLAMPGWKDVVATAQTTLAVLLDVDSGQK